MYMRNLSFTFLCGLPRGIIHQARAHSAPVVGRKSRRNGQYHGGYDPIVGMNRHLRSMFGINNLLPSSPGIS